jgi:hypothetical protein
MRRIGPKAERCERNHRLQGAAIQSPQAGHHLAIACVPQSLSDASDCGRLAAL